MNCECKENIKIQINGVSYCEHDGKRHIMVAKKWVWRNSVSLIVATSQGEQKTKQRISS